MENKDLEDTLQYIAKNQIIIEVFGLGYVGFPLSIRLAKAGFTVIGIDTDSQKIDDLKHEKLNESQQKFHETFSQIVKNQKFTPATSPEPSEKPKIGIICVPTPINTQNSNVFVFEAVEKFLDTSKKGDLIILESSIMAGTTEEIKDIIESKGYKVGVDFGLSFCPERIDPLNKKWNLENIPRVIYCSDDVTFRIAQKIYQHINNGHLKRVSSANIAEIVKSFENAFRLVNISLVNELAMLCDKLKINVNEVINAASTKPFGYMPFYSSAGAGGHCIPKDPQFLSKMAKKLGLEFSTINQATLINDKIPRYISNEIIETIKENNLSKSVLICGMSYKPDIEDMRDSPGFKILNEFKLKGFKISVYDPYYHDSLKQKYLIENNLKDIEFTNLKTLDDSLIQDYSPVLSV